MIMACSIAQVAYADLVVHTAWMSVVCFVVAWIILIRPIKMDYELKIAEENKDFQKNILDIVLSLSPVFGTFFLVVFFNLNASIAMGTMTAILFVVLRLLGRQVSLSFRCL